MAKTATFPCLASNVASQGAFDLVTVSFDAVASRGIMEFFTEAKRGKRGLVSIGISPIHKPESLILRLIGAEKPKPRMPSGMGFGYAADQVGPDGKLIEGLMPMDAAVPFDGGTIGGNDDHWTSINTTPTATDIKISIDTDSTGRPILSMTCTFPKSETNA